MNANIQEIIKKQEQSLKDNIESFFKENPSLNIPEDDENPMFITFLDDYSQVPIFFKDNCVYFDDLGGNISKVEIYDLTFYELLNIYNRINNIDL